MRLLRRIFGAVALLLVAFVAVGLLLPGSWSTRRERSVEVAPDSVYGILTRPRAWRTWMPWPEGGARFQGPGSGTGAAFTWDDPRYGSGRFELTSTEPLRRVEYAVVVEEGAVRIRGTVRIEPIDDGTLIVWSETGDFGWNPLLSYAALTMEDRQGEALDSALAGLARAVGGSSVAGSR